MLATFMPKPFSPPDRQRRPLPHEPVGYDGGTRPVRRRGRSPTGSGLSQLGYHFTGGLKKHAGAYIAVTAPTVNSYKRLTTTAGTPTSGATWSPIFITHGANNRTQMLRLPGGHVEDRTVDGSCNPYLAMAVILAAGLDGIENEIDPGPHNDENLYELVGRASCASAGSSCCPPTCWTRPATWPRTTSSARRWATPAPRTTWTTTSRPSRRSGTPTTSRSRRGRCSATSRSSRKGRRRVRNRGAVREDGSDRRRAGRAPGADAGAAERPRPGLGGRCVLPQPGRRRADRS